MKMNVRVMRGAAGLALSLSFVVGFGPSSPAPALAAGSQGLQGGWPIDDTGNVDFYHSVYSELPIIQQANAGWVRVNFRLGGCFSDWTSVGCNGKTAAATYDTFVDEARKRGLNVLGLVSNESWSGDQTAWTANNAEWVKGGNGRNAYVDAFATNVAGVLAAHFKGRVVAWEIWNEPNSWWFNDNQGHYSGGSYLYPSNYAWLLKLSYAAIKAVQPSPAVVSGGMFGHDPAGLSTTVVLNKRPTRVTKRGDVPTRWPNVANEAMPSSIVARGPANQTCGTSLPSGADSGATYVCALYSQGRNKAGWKAGAYPLDDIGQHLYVDQGGTTSSGKLQAYVTDLRNAYAFYEGAATIKRTQVTEVGWTTASVSSDVQRSNLSVTYGTMRGLTSSVARTYWFQVQDIPEANGGAGLFYGMVDGGGLPKPSFAAYINSAGY